jgi:hypothetical protein
METRGSERYYGYILYSRGLKNKNDPIRRVTIATSNGPFSYLSNDPSIKSMKTHYIGTPVLFSISNARKKHATKVVAIGYFQGGSAPFVYPSKCSGVVTKSTGMIRGTIRMFESGNGLRAKHIPFFKKNLAMTQTPKLMPLQGQVVEFFTGYDGTNIFVAQMWTKKTGKRAQPPPRGVSRTQPNPV